MKCINHTNVNINIWSSYRIDDSNRQRFITLQIALYFIRQFREYSLILINGDLLSKLLNKNIQISSSINLVLFSFWLKIAVLRVTANKDIRIETTKNHTKLYLPLFQAAFFIVFNISNFNTYLPVFHFKICFYFFFRERSK